MKNYDQTITITIKCYKPTLYKTYFAVPFLAAVMAYKTIKLWRMRDGFGLY